jgi:Serum amyloid A protein
MRAKEEDGDGAGSNTSGSSRHEFDHIREPKEPREPPKVDPFSDRSKLFEKAVTERLGHTPVDPKEFQKTLVEMVKEQLTRDKIAPEDIKAILERFEAQLGERAANWFGLDMVSPESRTSPNEYQAGRAIIDLAMRYAEMIYRDFTGGDRYMHCVAACEGASRGHSGQIMTSVIAQFREDYQLLSKMSSVGPVRSLADCLADTHVNRVGFEAGTSGTRCEPACGRFKPSGW